MKIMALDYGQARIGIALTDDSGTFVSPLCTIKNENTVNKLKNIISENAVELIVLGLPCDAMGEDTIQTKKIRNFKRKLEDKMDIEIVFQDENYSTRDAYDVLKVMGLSMKKSKKKVDEMAACIILEEYLKCGKNLNS